MSETDATFETIDPDGLDAAQAGREVDRLRARINELRQAYYQGENGSPEADADYDVLVRRLDAIEHRFPELLTEDSPTQTVGGQAQTTQFAPVEHAERMLSLDNVFSPDELTEWALKVQRDAGAERVRFLTELKIDGLAINLRYEHGRLVSAATRGDGVVGEDVTGNVRTMGTIPDRLSGTGHPPLVEVRGEIFFPVAEFDELNANQREAGNGSSPTRATPPPGPSARRKRASPRRSARSWSTGSGGCGCSCTASARGPCANSSRRPTSARSPRCTSCSRRGGCRRAATTGSSTPSTR